VSVQAQRVVCFSAAKRTGSRTRSRVESAVVCFSAARCAGSKALSKCSGAKGGLFSAARRTGSRTRSRVGKKDGLTECCKVYVHSAKQGLAKGRSLVWNFSLRGEGGFNVEQLTSRLVELPLHPSLTYGQQVCCMARCCYQGWI
jgi:hypothetical protein